MTRKNMKGIVGKKNPTMNERKKVGPGISFKDENLTTSAEIEEEIRKRKTDNN
ncbi:MAG: hypothetical protein ACOZCL_08980 [Bacillota bacterium]